MCEVFTRVFLFQLNMLLKLQEAANYSSAQSGDSDSNSLDSSHAAATRNGINMESTL